MDTTGTLYTVEEGGTRLSRDKRFSVEFQAGQQITLDVAYDYGFVDADAKPIYARPGDEVPDIAPDELEKRGLGAAPENKSAGRPKETKA